MSLFIQGSTNRLHSICCQDFFLKITEKNFFWSFEQIIQSHPYQKLTVPHVFLNSQSPDSRTGTNFDSIFKKNFEYQILQLMHFLNSRYETYLNEQF